MAHGLFKNFVFSVSDDGRLATVRVDIPQATGIIYGSDGVTAWDPTSLSDAPFSIHSPTQMEWDYPTPTTAEVSDDDVFVTYTAPLTLAPNDTVELEVAPWISDDNLFFDTSAPISPGQSVQLSEIDGVEMWAPAAMGPTDVTAPTLSEAGITRTHLGFNGETFLQDEQAFLVNFSERVSIPLVNGLFGGLPAGATITTHQVFFDENNVLRENDEDQYSDVHLVKVSNLPDGAPPDLVLKLQPKLSVESIEAVSFEDIPDNMVIEGSLPADASWVKLTLDGDLYGNGTFESPPQIRIADGAQEGTLQVATIPTEKDVIYLAVNDGFLPEQLPQGSEVSLYDYSAAGNILGGVIKDEAGNYFVLDAVDTGGPDAPRVAPVVTVVDDSNMGSFVSAGTASGIEILDLSPLSTGPLLVDAEYGFMTVYDANGQVRTLEIADYDKYVLNDRYTVNGEYVYGNTFYGTADSEYVVVGDGGDNVLFAGNQFSGSDKAETDIVDYSRITIDDPTQGIKLDLGNSASQQVEVSYLEGASNLVVDSDQIQGFEGVVGSSGADDIQGSNTGNYLSGGSGDDTLSGFSGEADVLYDQAYLQQVNYGLDTFEGSAAFDADASDILVGGEGYDTLYGGAGSDALIDLDGATMWGSEILGTDGGLRDSADRAVAEHDMFVVRGDGTEEGTATIENFHLSKDGTGLAGRSYSANDYLVFSADMETLINDAYAADAANDTSRAEEMFGEYMNDARDGLGQNQGKNLYDYVYSNLEFTQLAGAEDVELTATFSVEGYSTVVGSVIIADMVGALGANNRADVVQLEWLTSAMVYDPESFNPKLDLDMLDLNGGYELFSDLNIAVALELLQAGTVRSPNEYGVMAANLDDLDLPERIYNPGASDDRIVGSVGDDSYEFIVQAFTPPEPDGNSSTQVSFDTGRDTVFDTGGNDDALVFSDAKIEDLKFEAVRVGRESENNSLQVSFSQKATMDGGDVVTNDGEVTWQGHFRAGGRQAAEQVEVSDGAQGVSRYSIARTEYEYDAKGYVVEGSAKLAASSAFDAIMVGKADDNERDVFAFTVDATATNTEQTARIAGFDAGDKIDISDYVSEYGVATLAEDGSYVTFSAVADAADGNETVATDNFVLNLSFQSDTAIQDLEFALGLSQA